MLIVTQYYIIIKIKKTKTSRKDLKKEEIMRINNYSKFFAEVAKIINESIKAVKQLDGRYTVELTNHVQFKVFRGVAGGLFIHDHRGMASITSCYDFEDFKTLKDLYDRLVLDYSESEETEETEKHYADYTSEDFINSGIAKECTDCPDFCEEDCIENAECARGNDVFEGCKTVKEVMEVKQELNARFGKEQYFDTDSLQSNKAIIEKIENINHCPNQNTCCIVSPLVHCNYNYKSDSCIKAHKNFIHDCEQVHKQMKAKHNPEWHHVSLVTLANIDNDILDNKRRLYFTVWNELNKTLKNLHKCNSGLSYERALSPLRRWILELYHNKKITGNFKRYVDIKISMCNVECGAWSSAVEVATGQHESRKYNSPTLRY
jgi:hypothetical protein